MITNSIVNILKYVDSRVSRFCFENIFLYGCDLILRYMLQFIVSVTELQAVFFKQYFLYH